ncbi:MAG: M20/M25/M40 family metallo-hydrolase [bacterium]|nr:M20/M25/M40 family metallo-hydrolase [bacterium]
MQSGSDYPSDSPYLTPGAVADTLAALVGVNSVNPAYGGPEGGERRAAEWAAGFLRRAGLEPRLAEALPGRPNLRATLEGDGTAPPLLLETHIDTVSIAGMTIDPFAARVHGGRLWGRGATDAKAQAAALLHAMAAWAAAERRPPRRIELALTVDEEFGFGGAHALAAERPDVAGAVVGEPTGLGIVTTHKGSIRWWVRLEGRSAHSAHPCLGVNAIALAAALVREIDREYAADLAQRHAPLLEPPTINVSMIEGGVQANLVPPLCRLQLDRRTLPGETVATVMAEFEELLNRLRRRIPDFKAVCEPPILASDTFSSPPRNPLARAAGAAALAHGAESSAPMGVNYATDASVLAQLGLPIVIAGPGHIDQAHTADEFMRLDELAAGARFYCDLIGRPWPEGAAA